MAVEHSVAEIAEEVKTVFIEQLRRNETLKSRLNELNTGRRTRLDSNASSTGPEQSQELQDAVEKVVMLVLQTGLPSSCSRSEVTSSSGFYSSRSSTATLTPDTDEQTNISTTEQNLLERQGASVKTSRRRDNTRRREVEVDPGSEEGEKDGTERR